MAAKAFVIGDTDGGGFQLRVGALISRRVLRGSKSAGSYATDALTSFFARFFLSAFCPVFDWLSSFFIVSPQRYPFSLHPLL